MLTIIDAKKALLAWIKEQGVKVNTLYVWESWSQSDDFYIKCLNPFGLFRVNKKTGNIEDVDRYFSEENSCGHTDNCFCKYCKGE